MKTRLSLALIGVLVFTASRVFGQSACYSLRSSYNNFYQQQVEQQQALERQRQAAAEAQAAADWAAAQALEAEKVIAEQNAINTEARNLTRNALKASKGFLADAKNPTRGKVRVGSDGFLTEPMSPNNNGLGGGPDEFNKAARSGVKVGQDGFLTEPMSPNNNGLGGGPDEFNKAARSGVKVGQDGFLTEPVPPNNNGLGGSSDASQPVGTLGSPPALGAGDKGPTFVSNSAFENKYESWRRSPEGISERLRNVPTTESTQPYLRRDGTITTVGDEAKRGDAQFLDDINSPHAAKQPTASVPLPALDSKGAMELLSK